ncbi:MAG: hypothetical protein QGG00_12265, partial [Verrucomicrobiota bacterium]|nr:hypothetical protein [Verrucomicrobiota bacterium]
LNASSRKTHPKSPSLNQKTIWTSAGKVDNRRDAAIPKLKAIKEPPAFTLTLPSHSKARLYPKPSYLA